MAIQGTPDLETIQSFFFHFGDEKLMQYTGLKDKNGVEIYEGDILETGRYIRSAIWHEKSASWGMRWPEGSSLHYCSGDQAGLTQGWIDETETGVIGNIYENAELLG